MALYLDLILTPPTSIALRGHANFLRSVAFSPDGARLASVSFDSALRLLNLDPGPMTVSVQGGTYRVLIAAFFGR